MVLEGQRRETPFTVRDNMLDIWNQCTELSFRGFGKKERKSARTPRNFNAWSEESQIKWLEAAERKRLQQERWDQMFIENETKIVDGLCRDIVYFIDRANVINPQYICECNKQRLLQDDAIGYCHNLKREFNHIASVIPCNLNFLAIQSERVDYEISLLRKWKQSCNTIRKDILIKEKRKTHGVMSARANWWLRSVNSATNAANVNNNGNANNNGSSNANGVQPRFRRLPGKCRN